MNILTAIYNIHYGLGVVETVGTDPFTDPDFVGIIYTDGIYAFLKSLVVELVNHQLSTDDESTTLMSLMESTGQRLGYPDIGTYLRTLVYRIGPFIGEQGISLRSLFDLMLEVQMSYELTRQWLPAEIAQVITLTGPDPAAQILDTALEHLMRVQFFFSNLGGKSDLMSVAAKQVNDEVYTLKAIKSQG